MILLRLLGVGAVYGLGFMFVKSLFPEPFALLVLQGRQQRGQPDRTRPRLHGRRPDLRSHRSPLFGGILLLRRHGSGHASSGSRLALSLALALLMGLISGLLTLVAYATGILPAGGVLDPLRIIRASNFPTGTPAPRRLGHRPRPSAGRPYRALPITRERRPAAAPLRRRTPARAEALRAGRLLAAITVGRRQDLGQYRADGPFPVVVESPSALADQVLPGRRGGCAPRSSRSRSLQSSLRRAGPRSTRSTAMSSWPGWPGASRHTSGSGRSGSSRPSRTPSGKLLRRVLIEQEQQMA